MVPFLVKPIEGRRETISSQGGRHKKERKKYPRYSKVGNLRKSEKKDKRRSIPGRKIIE